MNKSALVLFSGGLDSTVCLFWSFKHFDNVSTLTISYGQRNDIETLCAAETLRNVHMKRGRRIRQNRLDLSGLFSSIGGSALTDDRMVLPEGRSASKMRSGVPTTYVPFRNGVFAACAAAMANAQGIDAGVGGWNVGFGGYPDCQVGFIDSMSRAIAEGTENAGVSTSARAAKVIP